VTPGGDSLRDIDALRRLLKKYSEADFDGLVARERAHIAASPSRRRGRPALQKNRQQLLAALYLARYCHKPCGVRMAAKDICRVIDFEIICPGALITKSPRSERAIEEDIRSGLKNKTTPAIADGLIWWRETNVNPEWGFGNGTPQQTIRVRPKKPKALIQWIDALIAVARQNNS
jgi:hypothetical protein